MAGVRVAGDPVQVRNREEFFSRQLDDEINNIEQLFGKIPDVVKNDLVYNQSRAYSDLTEYLLSKAPRVVDTQIRGLLLEGYRSVLLNDILPVRELGPHESIRVEWMQLSFSPGVAPRLAMEGVPPIFTHNRSKGSATAERRGAGLRIEAGFYNTDAGKEEFRQKIMHLAAIVQRTCEFDAMITLLQTSTRTDRDADGMNAPYNLYGNYNQTGASFDERLRNEVFFFGLVNKSEGSIGFSSMVTNVRTMMQRNGSAPDYLIVPPMMMNYYYSRNPDLWNYSSAGGEALQNRASAAEIGPTSSAYREREIQGMKVVDMHLYRPTTGNSGEETVDLLTVPKMIGEFYPAEIDSVYDDACDFDKYRGNSRNIRIFNEKHGVMATVQFKDMIRNCLRWEDDINGVGHLDEDKHMAVRNDMFKYSYPTQGGGVQQAVAHRWCNVRRDVLTRDLLIRVSNSLVHIGNCGTSIDDLNSVVEHLDSYYFTNEPIVAESGATILHNEQGYDDIKYRVIKSNNRILMKFVDELVGTIQGLGVFDVNDCILTGSTEYSFQNDIGIPFRDQPPVNANQNDVDMMYEFYAPLEQRNNGNIRIDPLRMVMYIVRDDETRSEQFQNNLWASAFARNLNMNRERAIELGSIMRRMSLFKRILTFIWLLSPINRETLVNMHSRNIFIPVNFLLCRPYITMNVSSTIFCKGGTELGETIIGNTSFNLSQTAGDRMILGTFVYHGKSYVKNKKLVTVAPNVFINSYVKGNDCTFINRTDLEEVQGQGGLFESKNSILCYMIPANENPSRHTTIDIRGMHNNLKNNVDASPLSPFFSTYQYYSQLLSIDETSLSTPLSQYADYEAMTYRANSICFRGHYEYGPNFSRVSPNTGHLGIYCYDGIHLSRTAGHYAPVRQVSYSNSTRQ